MQMRTHRNRNTTLFASSIALFAAASMAIAGNTWDGGGGDDNWGSGNNWNPDGSPSPGSGNDLFFGGSTRLTPFNNYGSFDDWRHITFNSGASSFNITGNAIDLFGSIENLSANSQTFGLTFSVNNGSQAIKATSGNLSLTGADVFTNGNTVTLNAGASRTLSVGNVISQGGGVSVTGAGGVTLTGNNSYGGATTISGSLSIGSIANGGSNSGIGSSGTGFANLSLDGGTLSYTGGASSTNRQFQITANGGTLDASGSGALTFAATSTDSIRASGTGNRTLTLIGSQTAANILAGNLVDPTSGQSSLTKSGNGTWRLTGDFLRYTGVTTVNSGRLEIATVDGAGLSFGGGFTVPGGTLQLNVSNQLANAGAVAVSGGTFDIGANSDTVGAVSLTSGSITGTSGTLTGSSYAVQAGSVSASLAGGGALTKTTGGTVTLSAANTYSGNTTVSGGTLTLANVNAVSGSTLIDVQAGATLDVTGASGFSVASFQNLQTAATGVVNGNVVVNGKITGNGTFNNTVTVNGKLEPGTSAGNLSMGVLVLNGNATQTNLEVDGTSRGVLTGYDAVNVVGAITYDGTLVAKFSQNFGTNQTFDFFDFVGADNGTFDNVLITSTGLSNYSVTLTNASGVWTGSQGLTNFVFTEATGILSLSLAAVPEPLTAAGVILLAGRVLARRSRISM